MTSKSITTHHISYISAYYHVISLFLDNKKFGKSEEKATGNTHGASIGAEWMIPRAICSFFQKFLLSRISDIT